MRETLEIQRFDWSGVVRRVSAGFRKVGSIFQQTFDEWTKDDASRLGAALAYYTAFSLAPLLIVVISVAGVAFGPAAVQGQVVWQIQHLIGRQAAEGVQTMLQAARPGQGLLAMALGLMTFFFGASLVVAELRNSLNIIWKVPARVRASGILSGLVSLLERRFFAFLLVLGIGFLLLVSLLMNAFIAAVGKYFQTWLPAPESVLQWVNFLVGFAVTTLVFALIYKVLPDMEIAWGDVVIGAAMTSLLFTGGKLLIALYLGKSSIASAYGAANSLVIILAWVYYSAQVFFFGAEFTRVYANAYGSRLAVRQRRW